MPLRRRTSHYQQLPEIERDFLSTKLHKDLDGMYPLCIIVESSDQGMVLPQEDRIPGSHVALLRRKPPYSTYVCGTSYWSVAEICTGPTPRGAISYDSRSTLVAIPNKLTTNLYVSLVSLSGVRLLTDLPDLAENGPNDAVQNVKLGGHQTCLSINRLWHELCDMFRRLVGITAAGHHDCSIQE
ncbi:DDE_3 domain-containing protein [Trichonephila clavipes]|uniref:DDE_3 domain-containing protein n=1 Tax=Trichonephila clavipes TaxID=2585209 RepID=A0A8X7BHE4_TRICX|nr:DDE_3 domain-containing protein [Trichonephila clavipes]